MKHIKKIILSIFIMLFVFILCPVRVLAAGQKSYDNLADLSTDNDKKDYFVWHDKTDDHIYILFYSNVFNLSNTWEGDNHMYDYYGEGFITDDLIKFTKTEAVWDKYNSAYQKDSANIEFVYSTKEIKNTTTNETFLVEGYQSNYKPDNDKKDDTDDNENTSLLSSLWGTVKDIFKSIGEGFSNLINSISNLWLNLKTALSNLGNTIIDGIYNAFISVLQGINKVLETIVNILDKIADTIKEALSFLFVPDSDAVKDSLNKLSQSVKHVFNLDNVDFSAIVSDGKQIEDKHINLYGKDIKIFDSSYIVNFINDYRKYIRAFFALLLILYNINQVMKFTKQGSNTEEADK